MVWVIFVMNACILFKGIVDWNGLFMLSRLQLYKNELYDCFPIVYSLFDNLFSSVVHWLLSLLFLLFNMVTVNIYYWWY